jgi:hypothetical protein
MRKLRSRFVIPYCCLEVRVGFSLRRFPVREFIFLKPMIDWYVDHDNFLRGFPYHDGELMSLTIERKGGFQCVHITVISFCRVKTVIRLDEVRMLSATNYLEGNILHDIFLFKYSELTPGKKERLKLDDSNCEASSLILLLGCSYGVELVAVCGNLQIPQSVKLNENAEGQ